VPELRQVCEVLGDGQLLARQQRKIAPGQVAEEVRLLDLLAPGSPGDAVFAEPCVGEVGLLDAIGRVREAVPARARATPSSSVPSMT